MPPDQNQLPSVPSEPQIYQAVIPVLPPAQDPWYSTPANLDSLRNGDIVRTREVQSFVLGIPIPVAAKQILYRSTNAHGSPLVTATTVLTPGIPWIGSPRPLVSYQEAIDSTASICNPSYTLRAGTFKEITLLQYFLEQGMSVAISDFDGQNMTWISPGEGRMVLDGIRAAQREPSLGLADSAVGLYGYSGGGNATASAAEQHHSYAPELRIVGSAQGGVPGDKSVLANWATSKEAGQGTWTMWPAIVGMSREYPDVIDLNAMATPEGLAMARDMDQRCVYTEAISGAWRPVKSYLKDPNVLQSPKIAKLLNDISFGRPGNEPDMPVFMWHSTTDQLLPIEAVTPMLHAYCNAGVDIRFFTIPISEHITADIAGWPVATAWLSLLLRGGPPGPKFCPNI